MTIEGFIESPVSLPLWVGITLLSGAFLYQLCRPFAAVKEGWGWKALLLLAFALASAMVIWVGDNNLLFTLPAFVAVFLLCTRGDRVGRLAVSVIFFCLMMAVCGLIDTYLIVFDSYDVLTRLVRPAVFGLLYLGMRGSLPDVPVQLPRRLWRLVLGLAAMPLCALVAVVLLTAQKYESAAVDRVAMSQGAVVLPFVLLTALVLLRAVLVLTDHERLEQSNRLAALRAVYYEGLRREQTGVRTLRHDLRNHLTALRGLLERGETGRALDYLDRVADAPALRGARRFCENETADIVLAAKAEELEQRGLTADWQIALPAVLPVADPDLCALLGNALDNAIEAACRAGDKRVLVRCRAEKGMLMLRVENALTGEETPGFATTKADKTRHGFGLAGMREIAARYGGTLEARAADGRFELVVCLPL